MNEESLLTVEQTVVVIVDVQVKLARVMHDKELVLDNLERLIKGVQVLGIPIIHTEQNPQGLGPTVPELSDLLSNLEPIPKLSFSCCGDENFMGRFKKLNRKQVLLAGIEAHVCVYQTAIDLLNAGYNIHVVTDAVDSRTAANKAVALERMRSAGAVLTSTEMALFELLKGSQSANFKEISRIIK